MQYAMDLNKYGNEKEGNSEYIVKKIIIIQNNNERSLSIMEQNILEIIYCIKHSGMPFKVQDYLIKLVQKEVKEN